MKYQEEFFKDIVEELKPLFQIHWEELANNKDVRPLDVDYFNYTRLNRDDDFTPVLKIFTVRTDEGKLIGYAFFFISYNLHYQTWLYAAVDVYFLDPTYRKLGVGTEFITEMEGWLKRNGVKSVTMMDKLNHSHESFFVKLGYKPIEQLYEKIL